MLSTEHLYALAAGTRLQNYTVMRVLGTGGFGITYFAREDITGRNVAIKEFLPAGLAARAADGRAVRPARSGAQKDFAWGLDRFREEAKLLIALRHPNIVPVLAYFEANGTGYLVMEFQDGESLGAILGGGRTLTEQQVRTLLAPLLDGIAEVHRRGFLHRDIKPDNIFVRDDGVPILLDFGAARQALGQRTRTLTSIVTDGYAPIEQYESTGEQGPWTDIYALGAVIFRALLGHKPADAPRRLAARMRNERDPLADDLAELATRCSPDIGVAVAAALALIERERPRTIADLRAVLDAGALPHSRSRLSPQQVIESSSGDTLLPLPADRSKLRRVLVWVLPAVLAAGAALAGAAWIVLSPADRPYLQTSGFGAVAPPPDQQTRSVAPEARPTVSTRSELTRRMHELVMSTRLEAIAIYRNSGAQKAMFACIDWAASSSASAAVRAVGYGYNYQQTSQAIERAAEECRKWSPGGCTCTLVDANLTPRLSLPDSFAAQHSR
jgi:serine/threonine protein kinase